MRLRVGPFPGEVVLMGESSGSKLPEHQYLDLCNLTIKIFGGMLHYQAADPPASNAH